MRTKILIWKNKYSDCVYDISTKELKQGAALSILTDNVDTDQYTDSSVLERALNILKRRDGQEAWDFISMRSNKGNINEQIKTKTLLRKSL